MKCMYFMLLAKKYLVMTAEQWEFVSSLGLTLYSLNQIEHTRIKQNKINGIEH